MKFSKRFLIEKLLQKVISIYCSQIIQKLFVAIKN